MPTIANPTFDQYDSILAYLSYSNARWNAVNDLGTNAIITYSFPSGDDLPAGGGSYGVDGFEAFTEAQQDGFRSVIAQVEAFSGLRFVEVENDAMIDGMIGLNGEGISGYASYPNVYGDFTGGSDLVMVYTDFEEPGSFSYYVAMHELGHALGLEHTHEGLYSLEEEDDITANSVMTYNYSPIPEVFGTFDVAALQHLYGDNTLSQTWDISVRENGDILTVGSEQSETLIGAASDNVIWAGRGSDIVFGRASDDVIVGQRGYDMLYGNAGRDILKGGNGQDVLEGGADADVLIGGRDADTFVFDITDGVINDHINDFTQGEDTIMIVNTGLSFQYLDFDISYNGENLIIETYYDTRIVLRGASDLVLTADDFVFNDTGYLG